MTVSNTETMELKTKRQHCESRVDLALKKVVGKRPKIQSKVIIPEKSDKSPIKRSQRVKERQNKMSKSLSANEPVSIRCKNSEKNVNTNRSIPNDHGNIVMAEIIDPEIDDIENEVHEVPKRSNDSDELNMLNAFDGVQVAVHASEDDFSGPESDDESGTETMDDIEQQMDKGIARQHVSQQKATASTATPFNLEMLWQWKDDPMFKKFISTVVNENLETRQTFPNRRSGDEGNVSITKNKLSAVNIENRACCVMRGNNVNTLKSPSDTTIYVPALKRVDETKESQEIITKISNFVDNICINSGGRSSHKDGKSPLAQPLNVTPTSRNQGVTGDKCVTGDKPQPQLVPSTSGKKLADNIIIDAERFKASVQPPKGRSLNIQRLLDNMDDDDDFFHVTCHIDPSLKAKIERGEFVDLERLLPKDKLGSGGNIAYESESKVGLVSHVGHTYFKPVRDRDAQITGLRKWEQAFRVYAAIYTEANPERSGEI